MRNIWALVGAVWCFLRIVLLYFANVLGQFAGGSPIDNLILLVFGAGSVGIIAMYLELFRSKDSLAVLRLPLRWSLASLLVLGLTCIILLITANIRFTGLVFGRAPATESLILIAIALLGDGAQFVILANQKPATPVPAPGVE